MSSFEQLVGGNKRRPAPRTFKLLPEYFAETWGNRPVAAFDVGLRVPGEHDYRCALAEAEKAAAEAREAAEKDPLLAPRAEQLAIAAYNSRLILFCVARGICSQHDVAQPHPYFELAEDEIPLALKGEAIKRIFDEIERLAVDQSPVFAEATPEDLRTLSEWLATDDPFAGVDRVQRGRCLRYLRLVLDTLNDD
jgi:hypothetical protein